MPPPERFALAADQLEGIGGASQMGFGPQRVRSMVHPIGQILREHPRAMKESPHDFTPAASA